MGTSKRGKANLRTVVTFEKDGNVQEGLGGGWGSDHVEFLCLWSPWENSSVSVLSCIFVLFQLKGHMHFKKRKQRNHRFYRHRKCSLHSVLWGKKVIKHSCVISHFHFKYLQINTHTMAQKTAQRFQTKMSSMMVFS